jgi:hypothetical protein
MRDHALAVLLTGAIVLAQLGGSLRGTFPSTTPGSSAIDRLERSVTRPVPTLPAPPIGDHPSDVWVPGRIIPLPDQPGGAIVPGHWERRLSEHQNYVPPLTATTPDGRVITVPGGVLPPPAERQAP